MLKRLSVRGFKSLREVKIRLPPLSILFGPNAVGKSNLIEAIQTLSWAANARTLFDALAAPFPVRGYPAEAFHMGPGGFAAQLREKTGRFTLEGDLVAGNRTWRYRIEPRIRYRTGELRIADEYLAELGASGKPKRRPAPPIERCGERLRIRRRGSGSRPREEPLGLNHTVLSDRSLSGNGYQSLDQVRNALASWRTYYLEPRMGMRQEQGPAAVADIGTHGEYIASFLYRLQGERPKFFDAVSRALRSVVPSVEGIQVQVNEVRGTLDLWIRQAGSAYSARIASEGTLRVLALCAIAANPWADSLVALEEPENGVDPRQTDWIARLLLELARSRQVLVTTHSPIFVDAILRERETAPGVEVGLFRCDLDAGGTSLAPLDLAGPLFRKKQVLEALTTQPGEGVFQSLLMRGFVDG